MRKLGNGGLKGTQNSKRSFDKLRMTDEGKGDFLTGDHEGHEARKRRRRGTGRLPADRADSPGADPSTTPGSRGARLLRMTEGKQNQISQFFKIAK
jgi:hypothetical protein